MMLPINLNQKSAITEGGLLKTIFEQVIDLQ